MNASRRYPWNACALALFTLLACSPAERDPADVAPDPNQPLFITQSVVPVAVMDALFDGRVVVDAAGCLRLDPGERVTVVWPKGFTLDRLDGEFRVRDAEGREVGRIGGRFRLGGGEVPALHAGVGLSAADRQRATSRCPGLFWIVGQVPRS